MVALIAILMLLGLTWFLTWYLLSKDKGEREPTGALWAALGFGALGLIPSGILELQLLPEDDLLHATLSTGQILLVALAVGIIEEVCKYLPLALFLWKKRYFNEHTDGILYFALAGLGFGLPENILYTLSFGGETGIARVILTPFFHAATTACVGYALIQAKLHGRRFWASLPMLGAMILAHGLYDFGLLSRQGLFALASLVITGGLTATIFTLGTVAKSRDQELGLSVVGVNTFCRSCGAPNPKKLLYCSRCGRRA